MIFAEAHINYRSPVEFDEEVAVGCSVGEVRRSAFRMDFAMHVGERLVAEGYGWLVGFDYEQQAAMRLPPELREALEAASGAIGRPRRRRNYPRLSELDRPPWTAFSRV